MLLSYIPPKTRNNVENAGILIMDMSKLTLITQSQIGLESYVFKESTFLITFIK